MPCWAARNYLTLIAGHRFREIGYSFGKFDACEGLADGIESDPSVGVALLFSGFHTVAFR